MTENMRFDIPKPSSIIKVIGVGGGGSNAVNYMYNQGINGVDFIVCNTDSQSLDNSPVPNKMQLGIDGLGAGSLPEVGRQAAIDEMDRIKEMLSNNTRMVFITAGMGGGTGTGAAPVIAEAAKSLGILTVGIVTVPFNFEGRNRRKQADEGIRELKEHVDALLIICNEKLRHLFGNLNIKNAFAHADNVLTTAAKGIAEIITVSGHINVDFNDVKTVMTNGGAAIMGYASAEGENRAIEAVEKALSCPLLNDNDISGASQVLLYITSNDKEESMATMDEIGAISDYIQENAGSTANIIYGTGFDDRLDDQISVIVIATGFQNRSIDVGVDLSALPEKKVLKLEDKNTEKKVEATTKNTDNDMGFKTYILEDKPVSAPQTETTTVVSNNTYSNQRVNTETITENTPVFTNSEKSNVIEFDVKSEETIRHPLFETATASTTNTMIAEYENPVNSETQVENKENTIKIISVSEQFQPSNELETDISKTEVEQKNHEKLKRLKDLSITLKGKSINELESKPAYLRRGVDLDPITPSSESHVSRYTLSNQDGKTELKENNSYLHDNVD